MAYQELLQTAITDLTALRGRIISISLFSPNSSETLSDVSTRDLVYLFVPFALAEVENRARTQGLGERVERIGRAQVSLLGRRVVRTNIESSLIAVEVFERLHTPAGEL